MYRSGSDPLLLDLIPFIHLDWLLRNPDRLNFLGPVAIVHVIGFSSPSLTLLWAKCSSFFTFVTVCTRWEEPTTVPPVWTWSAQTGGGAVLLPLTPAHTTRCAIDDDTSWEAVFQAFSLPNQDIHSVWIPINSTSRERSVWARLTRCE
jgi:hypothetical protein